MVEGHTVKLVACVFTRWEFDYRKTLSKRPTRRSFSRLIFSKTKSVCVKKKHLYLIIGVEEMNLLKDTRKFGYHHY